MFSTSGFFLPDWFMNIFMFIGWIGELIQKVLP